MKKWLLLMTLASVWIAPAAAENLEYNVLQFNESASVRVPNDTMTVVLRVLETGKSRQTVSNAVSHRVNTVLERAKNHSVFDVQNGNRSVYPERDSKGTITSWTDSADIRISSTDFDALNKLVADSQHDAMLDNVSFSVSPKNHTKAVSDASDKALQSFRQRAKQMSQSLGFSGYKIVKIQLNQSFENNDSNEYAEPVAFSVMAFKAKSRTAEVMSTRAGTHEIRQTIQATVQMQ